MSTENEIDIDLNSTLDDILKEYQLEEYDENDLATEEEMQAELEERKQESVDVQENQEEQVEQPKEETEIKEDKVEVEEDNRVDEREEAFNKLNADNENLRKEIEELKRNAEQHKALKAELDRLKEIAEEKNVDLTKSDYDITLDDIKELEENYPEQGKMIRALYKKIEKLQATQVKDNVEVKQENDIDNHSVIVNEVNKAIDKVPELRLWSDYRDQYSKEWEIATRIDSELQKQEVWANKSMVDRFKEVLKLTKDEIYKKKVNVKEVVDNAKLETPSSPSMLNGSVVQSDDRLQRFKNMSENDILSGALSNSDVEYIWDHL